MIRRILGWLLALSLATVAVFFLLRHLRPCASPILYSIGAVDPRFGISKADFAEATAQAAKLWSNGAQRPLFAPVSTGGLAISALYDQRQQARDQMKTLGIHLDAGRQSYDQLHARYDALKKNYDAADAAYEQKLARYNERKDVYGVEAHRLAQNGGVTAAQARQFNQEHDALNAQADSLNEQQAALQKQAADINAVVSVLRDLAAAQNLSIDQFQSIGSAIGNEYEAGLYESDARGQRISAYSFEGANELRRLLAHELGHALGLGHLVDSGSIMYYLNQSKTSTLSATDLRALRGRCGL
jgi:prefoldin subunit 5